jgi:hypothetical protein
MDTSTRRWPIDSAKLKEFGISAAWRTGGTYRDPVDLRSKTGIRDAPIIPVRRLLPMVVGISRLKGPELALLAVASRPRMRLYPAARMASPLGYQPWFAASVGSAANAAVNILWPRSWLPAFR